MKFQNRERLLKKLAQIQGKPRMAIREALGENAEELTAMQKRLVPVGTGALKASIGYTFGNYTPDNANVRGVSGGGGGDPDLSVTIHAGNKLAWYARLVEDGTRNARVIENYFGHRGVRVTVAAMPAQPFFFVSYRLLKRRLKSRVTRKTRKALREAVS